MELALSYAWPKNETKALWMVPMHKEHLLAIIGVNKAANLKKGASDLVFKVFYN